MVEEELTSLSGSPTTSTPDAPTSKPLIDSDSAVRKRATTFATVDGQKTHGVSEITDLDLFRDDAEQLKVSSELRDRNSNSGCCGRTAPLFGDIYFGNIKSGSMPIFVLCYVWIYFFIIILFGGLQNITAFITGSEVEEMDLSKVQVQAFVGFLLIPGLAATSHKCSRLPICLPRPRFFLCDYLVCGHARSKHRLWQTSG